MSACPRCELQHQCLCPQIPTLDCQVPMLLLTHPNELTRDTNTGKLLQWCGLPVERHTWDRKTPPPALLARLNDPTRLPILLFPSECAMPLAEYQTRLRGNDDSSKQPLFIILDATWQEARKMRNKSAWLSHLPELQLDHQSGGSRYSLRRNQQPGNLCTCEVGELLLEQLGYVAQAETLARFFQRYLAAFKADKSGHALR